MLSSHGSEEPADRGRVTLDPLARLGWVGQDEFGDGGRILVTTGTQLQAAIAWQKVKAKPLTIVIDGPITPENSQNLGWIDVCDVANVSIVGYGAGTEFDHIGIRLTRADNITLRRLYVPDLVVGEKDAIHLEGYVDHAWVDHSEISNDPEGIANANDITGSLASQRHVGFDAELEPEDTPTGVQTKG